MHESADRHLTRREMLRLLAPAVIAGFSGSHNLLAAEENDASKFSFIAVNDLHYFDAECGSWFRRVVEAMHESAPKAEFCLISGDVSDKGTAEALAAVREIFAALQTPVHTVPGNHDYLSQNDGTGYDAIYPQRRNYRFTHNGWQFLGLDTTEGLLSRDTTIAAGTLAFAEDESLDRSAPTVVFTHFPLGETVALRPRNADALLERLFKLNLRAAFSGHWHGASERHAGNAILTTDRCCARIRQNADGSPLKGWFVCEATADGGTTRRFVSVPA
jgi:3',5'-cyclic AMP phosphodiesterase CpdA